VRGNGNDERLSGKEHEDATNLRGDGENEFASGGGRHPGSEGTPTFAVAEAGEASG
jgi:hypothetical protein